MRVLMELKSFRLVYDGSGDYDAYDVEIDTGVGPEGHYWIPATPFQLVDFVLELGESLRGH